jgi:predicted kinase
MVTPKRNRQSPTLFVLVGLPGSGKTSRARELEAEQHALRLTPDEWMIPLFGEPEAGGKRYILEGRFIALGRAALQMGISVVLDFGVWSRNERSALRSLAADAGAECEVVYLPIDPIEQRRRVHGRVESHPESTYSMRFFDLDEFARQFEPPDQGELKGDELPSPPEGFASWSAWSAHRWPSSDA